MDFASQAHRDKLNLNLRLKLFTDPLLVTTVETATYTIQSHALLRIPLRARYRRIPMDWSIARGNAANTNSYQRRITRLGAEML